MDVPIATRAALEHAERMFDQVLSKLGVTREQLRERIERTGTKKQAPADIPAGRSAKGGLRV